MIKARQVLGRKSNGDIVSLHLSENGDTAKQVFNKLRDEGKDKIVEIALIGPWGMEKRHKFAPKTELKLAKAIQL